jgi:hypothetical protein
MEIANIRFVPMPYLERCLAVDAFRGRAIFQSCMII